MKKTLMLFSLLTISYSQLLAQDSSIYSIKRCVDIAFENNLQVKQSNLQLERSNILLNQAKSNRLPDLFADLNHGLNQGRSIDPFTNSYINQEIFYGSYGLGTSVILFNGGQLKNLVKQNQQNEEAGKMDVQQSKDNIMLNVLLAYLQVLNNEEQLHQSQNQLVLTRKQVERLTQLNNEGSIIPAQLYELKGQQANDELAVVNNSNAVETAKLSLCQLMNIPYNKNMKVEQVSAADYATKYIADPESIYQQALEFIASVKAADMRTKSAATAVKVSRGAFYPQVSFGANINTNYSNAAQSQLLLNTSQVASGDFVTVGTDELPVITTRNNYLTQKIGYTDQFRNNYNTSFGVNVRVPIFNRNTAKNNLLLSKNALRNNQYILETTRIQLKQSIEQAAVNMNAAYDKYTLLLQQVSDFDAAFKIADVRYKAGVSTQVDYLIAKNNSDRAAINLILAKYDYIFRTKILDYYQNRLNLQ